MLNERKYAFANVPYRLKSYAEIVADPKNSITFDNELHQRIMALVPKMGADAKLILDNTKLVSDEILVMPLEYSGSDDYTSGIQMTTNPNWSTYQDSMVQEVEAEEGAQNSEEYDPYASVEEA